MQRKSPRIVICFAALGCVPLILAGNPALATMPRQRDMDNKASNTQPQIPEALPKGKKIILKDGSYQLAREYSVQGDRVRYWSVESSQWEEIPASLVDWDATHKSEAEFAARDAELKAKIRASAVAQRTKDIDVDLSLEIKPGLFLPDKIGLYALDRNNTIRQMTQSTAEVKQSTGREMERILTGVPFIPGKATMALAGTRAAMRISTAEPEFFMRPVDRREPRFRLLRAQVKNGHRLIDNISLLVTGEEKHNVTDVEIQTWVPATGVYRYTVEERLAPGEYAFVEMTADGINGYVWDFGVDGPEVKSK
ncbi:MAG TPA: hypothetical protein VHS08_04885 [Candidatus Acidoferrales bacterium]|nr:hypothetical protein [Candidatus Acidoferrales bacterium]